MHYLDNHTHDHDEPDGPGLFEARRAPIDRDYGARAFTVGIGGPVGSGKTALLLALCRLLRDDYSLAVVTNDIFTKEDGEFLVRNQALPAERITAVETGGCPHTAVRDDVSVGGLHVKADVRGVREGAHRLGRVEHQPARVHREALDVKLA